MGFVEFLFETKKGKTIMGLLYGIGAAVVIVGALFKIMHWPGAGPMLVIGLGTEALIFVVSAFEPVHMDLDWTLVYPELAGMDEGHGQGGHSISNKPVTEQLDDMLAEAKIGPELIESLGQGLRKLGDNANKLAEISDASVATNDYTNSLKSASHKVSELADTYAQASQALTGLSNAAQSGSSTGEELQKMASTLEALNKSYEVQLAGSQQQAQTMHSMYEGINSLMTNLSDSVEDTKRYKENISELSVNLAKLNTVYGNMLTAMTVR
ncbi:MAG: gliding motility protein GldL [Flavobacteriales bacterium]|nr:MAG: gliding motility protein GldL [Flavobacteriales bacterium]MBE7443588.1 gliding motility protein GldL [Flavobacteriales bacterium]MBX2958809.1 gliding motility protein GldL [Flavobacteriales bacterium]HRN41060.1 gliding motility protein GldL [Vicingus sp.]